MVSWGQPSLAFARLARQSIILWCSIMTTRPDPTDLSERYVDPPRDHDFPAKRHTVPLAIGFPNVIGFSACIIAPGLEIREATQTDIDRLDELNKTWASTLSRMHMVPLARSSHVICIDEQLYGHYVEQQIHRETGKSTELRLKGFRIDDIYKMIVTALHLFRLVPLYVTRYFITEEYDKNFVYPGFLSAPVQVIFESWQRYAVPSGYNLTSSGTITCDDVIRAVNVLGKYYQYNNWVGNRIAVALHNFWNALFVRESTLAFVALVTVIETFTNLNKGEGNTAEQIYINSLKLVPIDGHDNAVTRERLEEMYSARSELSHGSYGRDGRVRLGLHLTHLDAKLSNVDVHLSTGVMSITAKMLHKVLFDPTITSILEGAKTSAQERRQLRKHLNAMPGAEASSSTKPALIQKHFGT